MIVCCLYYHLHIGEKIFCSSRVALYSIDVVWFCYSVAVAHILELGRSRREDHNNDFFVFHLSPLMIAEWASMKDD